MSECLVVDTEYGVPEVHRPRHRRIVDIAEERFNAVHSLFVPVFNARFELFQSPIQTITADRLIVVSNYFSHSEYSFLNLIPDFSSRVRLILCSCHCDKDIGRFYREPVHVIGRINTSSKSDWQDYLREDLAGARFKIEK